MATKKLIHIPNITKADLVKPDIFITHQIIPSKSLFDRLPREYINDNLWPKSSNLNCWYCHDFCKLSPWAMVISVENNGELTKFQTDGIFCNPWCVTAYIFDNIYDKHKKHNYLRLFAELYYKRTGIKLNDSIPRAPKYTLIENYGGNKTRDEYRQILKSLNYSNNKKEMSIDQLLLKLE